ncbi:MAG: hypothetical protein QXF17_01385 [Ignisphaera sp.]
MAKLNSPLFGNVTVAIRTDPRYKVVIRRPTPWDARNPNYFRAIEERPALYKATATFSVIASHGEAKGIPWKQRLEIIRRVLRGKNYGGVTRTRHQAVSEKEINRRIAILTDEAKKALASIEAELKRKAEEAQKLVEQ